MTLIWAYRVSGKQVLLQWFSYRKKNRERPVIGGRRLPSKLGDIQPDHWLPEYTTELPNVLNILGLLIDLEPERPCSWSKSALALSFRRTISRSLERLVLQPL